MDRIRKALDEARKERTRPRAAVVSTDHIDAQPVQPAKPADPAQAAPAPVAAPPRNVPRLPASIVYSQTKTFEPKPETFESNRIVNPAANSPAAAAFRMLRTQVLQRLHEHGWRTLALLSPGAHEGKTTTAINLAMSIANDQRQTVLLVDCDLRRPSVASTLGIEPEFGLDDVLKGQARIEQCLYHPAGVDRFVVLPTRAPMENSAESLSGHGGRDVTVELRERYPDRIVIFDLPPVLMADDALAFLPLVESALIVVAEGSTSRQDLLRCMELTRRTPIIGTVLNRATDVSSAYG